MKNHPSGTNRAYDNLYYYIIENGYWAKQLPDRTAVIIISPLFLFA